MERIFTKTSLKQRNIIGVVLNLVIVVITTTIMCSYVMKFDGQGPLGEFTDGLGSLKTFTNESNILCALVALITACFGIRNLVHKKYYFPHALRTLQLIGTTVVFLTFVTVLFFLTPLFALQSGEPLALFSGNMFFTHFLTPLLAILVFVFFTPSKANLATIDNLLVLIPVVAYGSVYLANVLFLQIWPDFYNFTLGGRNQLVPIVFAIMLAVTFGLARLLITFQKIDKK